MDYNGIHFKHKRLKSPRGERRDCGVRALAAAAGVSYEVAHHELAKAGRKNRFGTASLVMETAAFNLGFVPAEGPLLHKQLREIAPALMTGRWVVGTRGHYFAVENGWLRDSCRGLVHPTSIIRELYRMS